MRVTSSSLLRGLFSIRRAPPRHPAWTKKKRTRSGATKPPLNVISRKTTTIADGGPSQKWHHDGEAIAIWQKATIHIYGWHVFIPFEIKRQEGEIVDARWGCGWMASSTSTSGSFQNVFSSFSRFSIFYGFFFVVEKLLLLLMLLLSLWRERESSGWADAIWYLKLLSLLVMFVKFFICKQRSQWYLRQSAIWFDAFVFSSFFACFSFRPPHRHRSRRHLNSHSPPPTDDKKSERRLSTATFDNLTICRQCYSSVKVLWL